MMIPLTIGLSATAVNASLFNNSVILIDSPSNRGFNSTKISGKETNNSFK